MPTTRKIRVEVEKYHIDNGHPKSAELNPFVLALGPRLPCGETEATSDGWIQFYDVERSPVLLGRTLAYTLVRARMLAQFQLPQDAADYIDRGARGEKPEPASFEVEVPDFGKGAS